MPQDWYDKAREEFLFDLYIHTETDPNSANKIYSYLSEIGLVDYDVEKEFLYDNYVEYSDDDD